jgi:hypothetical protein
MGGLAMAGKFVVDLGGVTLPKGAELEIEREIQKVALRVLADIDFRGDLKIGRLPPDIYGFIIDIRGDIGELQIGR